MKVFERGLLTLMGVLSLQLLSCNDSDKSQSALPSQQKVRKDLESVNRQRMREEDAQIEGYVERRGWPMIKTGTGLRYWIYESGDTLNKKAEEGQIAQVYYDVMLLNGDTVYSSKEEGLRDFLIGQDNVETGLHEGITYMRVGEKARFVLPSHLAHGLTGDQVKIPPLSSVIYDISLISLK